MAKSKFKKYLITFEIGSITMRIADGEAHIIHKAKTLAAAHPELGVKGSVIGFERV